MGNGYVNTHLNAITDTGTDKSNVQLSSNTLSNARFDMIKDSEVFYQWGTDRINMSIPIQNFHQWQVPSNWQFYPYVSSYGPFECYQNRLAQVYFSYGMIQNLFYCCL